LGKGRGLTLADNAATRALIEMLPIAIAMRDHLRQEKAGDLPAPSRQPRGSVNSLLERSAFGGGSLHHLLPQRPRAFA
jgi:hypothetical protein